MGSSFSNDYSMVTPKTFVLKLINMECLCLGCETEVKKLTQEVHGVHSFSIDADQRKLTVSGTVDPSTLIKKLKKAGKKAELLPEQNMQIAQARPVQDQQMVAQLQQLSEIKGLKHVQLTYSKTVKLSFKGQKAELSHEDHGGTTAYGGGHGGAAAAPCCGGHEMNYNSIPYYGHHGTYHGGPPWDWYRAPPPCGCIPPWSHPVISNYEPTAPPPPVAYPFPDDIYGDYYPNGWKFF